MSFSSHLEERQLKLCVEVNVCKSCKVAFGFDDSIFFARKSVNGDDYAYNAGF